MFESHEFERSKLIGWCFTCSTKWTQQITW